MLDNDQRVDDNSESPEELGQPTHFEHQKPVNSGLNKSQKIAAGVLILVGMLVFSIWFSQMNKNIQFADNIGNKKPQECSGPNCNANEEELLKLKDTDGDGLSDWDELYVYKTSPYLEDSDSDGISDYDEVMRGTDPNCPEGRTCGVENFLYDEEAEISESLIDDMLGVELTDEETQDVDEQDLEVYQKLISGSLSAEELRKILISQGIDAEVLETISDEQLLQSYKETMAE